MTDQATVIEAAGRVMLSAPEGPVLDALTGVLEARGLVVVPGDPAGEVPGDIAALVIADLAPSLMVDPDAGAAQEQVPGEAGLAWIEGLIAAAGKAGTPRIVLVGAARAARAAAPRLDAATARLEAALAKAAEAHAVILRASDVMHPDAPGLRKAVGGLMRGERGLWPRSDVFQGIGLGDLALAVAGAVSARGVEGLWFDIAIPEAIEAASLQREAVRLGELLTNVTQTEVVARPSYPAPQPLCDGRPAERALHLPLRKSHWTLLAETVQGIVRDAGTIDLRPPMQAAPRAIETGALPLAGAEVVLTGATGAIGAALAERLVRLGATVVGLGRRAEAGAALATRLSEDRERFALLRKHHAACAVASGLVQTDDYAAREIGSFRFEAADLTVSDSRRALAARLASAMPRIDVLIHAAGEVPLERSTLEDGTEVTLASHLVGPLALTRLLAEPLSKAGRLHGAKVLHLVSRGPEEAPIDLDDLGTRWAYSPEFVHARVQSGLIMMTQALAEVTKGSGVLVAAVDPGEIRSDLREALIAHNAIGAENNQQRQARLRPARAQLTSPEQGADRVLEALLAPALADAHGVVIADDAIAAPPAHTTDRAAMVRLWGQCAALGGLDP